MCVSLISHHRCSIERKVPASWAEIPGELNETRTRSMRTRRIGDEGWGRAVLFMLPSKKCNGIELCDKGEIG